MKPYDSQSPCASCGATNASSLFQRGGNYPNPTDKDRIQRVCNRCMYAWYERPLFGVEIDEAAESVVSDIRKPKEEETL